MGTTSAALAANQSEPGVFYAASNRGIYRSTDAGITWERLDVEWGAPLLENGTRGSIQAARAQPTVYRRAGR